MSVFALTGCNRSVVSGIVENRQGEALPGVAVGVEGTEYGDLSDALGHFEVQFQPGDVKLTFNKSGYAPTVFDFYDSQGGVYQAPPVSMWPLPPIAGVYVYRDSRYYAATRDTPERFFMAEGEMAYGTKRDPDTHTSEVEPFIVCYKLPRYDARLTRLQRAQAKLGATSTSLFEVWAATGTLGARLIPVDEPEGLLLRLELDAPLDPGVYAVHWGALEGFTTLEERMFVFSIDSPELPAEPEPIEPTESIEPEPAETPQN